MDVIKGTVASAFISGEADIEVTEDGFALASALDAAKVSWADVIELGFSDYTVNVKTKTGAYSFTRLGYDAEPLYNHMLVAYGAKVRKALFVGGNAMATAKGDTGTLRDVPIEVYDNCLVSLPPDLSARRVPLCFVNGFEDKDFGLTVSTIDGASFSCARLGYEHAPVVKAAQDAVKALRAKAVEQIVALCPSLSGEQASMLGRLMPEGMAAPMGRIREVSPAFAAALEEKIAGTRAAETYKAFQEIASGDSICVGFKADFGPGFGSSGEGGPDEESGAEIPTEESGAETSAPASAYMLWLIAPAQSGQACAVEFAGAENEAAATYVYRFDCPWDVFRIRLSMALEAIAFKRDAIRFSDEELAKPENEIYRMANDRNEALRLVRSCFAGRAIHRSMDSWRARITELLE